jgi:hypothetical protein
MPKLILELDVLKYAFSDSNFTFLENYLGVQ